MRGSEGFAPVRAILPRPRRNTAFTLIELLIVVAIISILAAIAVPNFLEAQTRSKVARIRADMRSFATAVESYRVDNNRYPPRSKFPIGGTFLGAGDVTLRAEELAVFTTPVAYITTIPSDVFETNVAPPNNLIDFYEPVLVEHLRTARSQLQLVPSDFVYARGQNSSYPFGWAMMSVGPDKLFGTPNNMGNYPPSTRTTSQTWWHEYDPTNGTVSDGNLYRFSRNGATADDAFNKK